MSDMTIQLASLRPTKLNCNRDFCSMSFASGRSASPRCFGVVAEFTSAVPTLIFDCTSPTAASMSPKTPMAEGEVGRQ